MNRKTNREMNKWKQEIQKYFKVTSKQIFNDLHNSTKISWNIKFGKSLE